MKVEKKFWVLGKLVPNGRVFIQVKKIITIKIKKYDKGSSSRNIWQDV